MLQHNKQTFCEIIISKQEQDQNNIEKQKLFPIQQLNINNWKCILFIYKNNHSEVHPIKEKLIKYLISVINRENDFVNFDNTARQPKAYISSGNNGMLVKSVLQQRWWWSPGRKEDENLNLSWTQWCKKSFVQSLLTKAEQLATESPILPLEASSVSSEASIKSKKYLPLLPSITQNILRISNHLENHFHLSNKKALFLHMQQYYQALGVDPFLTLPLTFHVRSGLSDPEFDKFKEYYNILETQYQQSTKDPTKGITSGIEKNIWIIKPGENSNRGNGIQVQRDYEEIKKLIELKSSEKRTFIVQKYIEKPLLINRRKFDIRMFALLTGTNGTIKGYFYEEGYIRTSSKEFTLKNLTNKAVHLTNDAVQQKNEDYGKYEPGNKLSFMDFQKYLDANYSSINIDFFRDILPQIKKIITDTIRAVYSIIDPNRRLHSFEIFGYDFMIDSNFKVLLIEVNTNPCLELSSVLLGRLIPQMVDSAMRIAVDPLFPIVDLHTTGKRMPTIDFLCENKFQLVFDEKIDAKQLTEYISKRSYLIEEIEEEDSINSDSDSQIRNELLHTK